MLSKWLKYAQTVRKNWFHQFFLMRQLATALGMNSGGVLDDLDHSFKLFAWDGRGKAWDLAQISLWNFNKWHPSLQMKNGEKLGIWNNLSKMIQFWTVVS